MNMDIDDDAGVQMAAAFPEGDQDAVTIPESLFVALQLALAGANPHLVADSIEFAIIATTADSAGGQAYPVVMTTLKGAGLDLMLSLVGDAGDTF
jgi:hypothetical protein